MSVGISTDGTKQHILENEPEKLKDELKAKQKELGLADMVPTHEQDTIQQLKDIQDEKNNILERMQMEKEKRLKRTAEERKAKQKTFKEKLNLYLAQQERKALADYNSRRLIYLDGEFEDYIGTIRMMPCRVLVKEIREEQNGLITLPVSHTEKYPKNVVLCVADDVDDIEIGDTVIAEAYAGIEIVSDKNIYRILFDKDILLKLEK